jgi:hypothetical protein
MPHKHWTEDLPTFAVADAIRQWHLAGWSPERIKRRLERIHREYVEGLKHMSES